MFLAGAKPVQKLALGIKWEARRQRPSFSRMRCMHLDIANLTTMVQGCVVCGCFGGWEGRERQMGQSQEGRAGDRWLCFLGVCPKNT